MKRKDRGFILIFINVKSQNQANAVKMVYNSVIMYRAT